MESYNAIERSLRVFVSIAGPKEGALLFVLSESRDALPSGLMSGTIVGGLASPILLMGDGES